MRRYVMSVNRLRMCPVYFPTCIQSWEVLFLLCKCLLLHSWLTYWLLFSDCYI
uniref:Uncharacterized protein n=1 Tax=Ciona intestinalis TaxID=7719 RepID=H2XWW1_CIOIN